MPQIVDRCRSAALDFCLSASSTVGPASCKRVRCRASVMEILVDRFLRTRNGLVFDLASGSEVVFTRSTASAGREHSAWVDRCAALASIRHPHLVELVDYGLIGVAHRFEALGMPGVRRLGRPAMPLHRLRSVRSCRFCTSAGCRSARSGGSE